MQPKKKTRPSRQANGRAHQSTASVPQHRLSDEEWAAAWNEAGPLLVAGFTVFFVFLTIF